MRSLIIKWKEFLFSITSHAVFFLLLCIIGTGKQVSKDIENIKPLQKLIIELLPEPTEFPAQQFESINPLPVKKAVERKNIHPAVNKGPSVPVKPAVLPAVTPKPEQNLAEAAPLIAETQNLAPNNPEEERAVLTEDFHNKALPQVVTVSATENPAVSASETKLPVPVEAGIETFSISASPAAIDIPTKEPAAANGRGSKLSEYLALVRAQIEENKEYPVFAKRLGLQGTVVVRAWILSNGSLQNVEVISSSEHKSLDKSALSTVKATSPFKSPSIFELKEVVVDIPITYKIN